MGGGGGGGGGGGDQPLKLAYAIGRRQPLHGPPTSRTLSSRIHHLGKRRRRGHVTVEIRAISAYSACTSSAGGQHAFIGGYTVVTRDALPYAKTVGNRARIYGLNSIGLARRGFSPELIGKLRRAYRHLVRHNTSRALELIDRDPTLSAPEVTYLVNFIMTSRRGVILRRPSKRVDDLVDVE